MADENTQVAESPSAADSVSSTEDLLYGGKPETPAESAPAEEASEATGTKPEAETEPASEPGKSKEPEKEEISGARKRINQLWAKNKELEEELARVRAGQTQARPEPKPEGPNQAPVRPQIRDYDLTKAEETVRWDQDMAKYERQLGDYQAAQIQARQQQIQAEARQREAAERRQNAQETWLDKGRAQFEDFDQVVKSPTVFITPHAVDVLMGLEHGPEVLYNDLGMKPEESRRIARLMPHEQTAELVRLHAAYNGIAASPKTPEKPNPKKPQPEKKPPADVGGVTAVASDGAPFLEDILYPK